MIRRLWKENPLWGQKRIAAELRALGFDVSPRTVAKYRPRGHRRGRQRWSTFLHNHLGQTWATSSHHLREVRDPLFVVLALDRREIVHIGVTDHPGGSWSAQRIFEAVADAGQAPRFLVRDRDSIYGEAFSTRLRGLGVRQLVTPPQSPRANAFAERVAGTLRRDCLDHVLVWNERHAEQILRQYVRHYHYRPHRGLRMQPPHGARWLRPCDRRPVIGKPVLGGLHHEYGFQPRA